MIRENNMTIQSLVAEHDAVKAVLDSHGIDYSPDNPQSLRAAVEHAGHELYVVKAALALALQRAEVKAEGRDWSQVGLTELVDYIVAIHHEFLKRELPRIEALFTVVLDVHKEYHSELIESLYYAFLAAKRIVEVHMAREERLLFPYIQRLDAYTGEGKRPPFPYASAENPIHQLHSDHEYGDMAMAEMRALTSDYRLPDDACPQLRALYEGLKQVEADVHEHTRLEDEHLFPRALQREHDKCNHN